MDISASQYNSASESGWTHYLEQSSLSKNYFQRRNIVKYEEGGRIDEEEEEEECEEDLSMVSDASSGPPHYDDAPWYCENYWYSKESQKKKKKKNMVKEYGKSQQQHSHLDDTASSPVFNFPMESHKNKVSFSGNGAVEDALDFSQCLSVTRIKRKQKIQKHFRGKQASEEPGGFDEE